MSNLYRRGTHDRQTQSGGYIDEGFGAHITGIDGVWSLPCDLEDVPPPREAFGEATTDRS